MAVIAGKREELHQLATVGVDVDMDTVRSQLDDSKVGARVCGGGRGEGECAFIYNSINPRILLSFNFLSAHHTFHNTLSTHVFAPPHHWAAPMEEGSLPTMLSCQLTR